MDTFSDTFQFEKISDLLLRTNIYPHLCLYNITKHLIVINHRVFYRKSYTIPSADSPPLNTSVYTHPQRPSQMRLRSWYGARAKSKAPGNTLFPQATMYNTTKRVSVVRSLVSLQPGIYGGRIGRIALAGYPRAWSSSGWLKVVSLFSVQKDGERRVRSIRQDCARLCPLTGSSSTGTSPTAWKVMFRRSFLPLDFDNKDAKCHFYARVANNNFPIVVWTKVRFRAFSTRCVKSRFTHTVPKSTTLRTLVKCLVFYLTETYRYVCCCVSETWGCEHKTKDSR